MSEDRKQKTPSMLEIICQLFNCNEKEAKEILSQPFIPNWHPLPILGAIHAVWEDVGYVAEPLNENITLYKHPQEREKIVGVRLEGYDYRKKDSITKE